MNLQRYKVSRSQKLLTDVLLLSIRKLFCTGYIHDSDFMISQTAAFVILTDRKQLAKSAFFQKKMAKSVQFFADFTVKYPVKDRRFFLLIQLRMSKQCDKLGIFP